MRYRAEFLLIFLVCYASNAFSQTAHYVTKVLKTESSLTNNNVVYWKGTNEVYIAAGEAGELITYSGMTVYAEVGDYRTVAIGASYVSGISGVHSGVGTTIAGPARFVQEGFGEGVTGLMTVKITPEAFPPDKTVIIPPGNRVAVTLECSTNLVQWSAATNGIYGDPNSAKFFRIRAQAGPQ